MNTEKRRNKRLPISLEIKISELYKQDNIIITDINKSIEVRDVSKSGLGFFCKQELPIGYYFDANIQLPFNHFLTVIKIIRSVKLENGYRIGSEFIGLSDILSKSVEEYDIQLQEAEKL